MHACWDPASADRLRVRADPVDAWHAAHNPTPPAAGPRGSTPPTRPRGRAARPSQREPGAPPDRGPRTPSPVAFEIQGRRFRHARTPWWETWAGPPYVVFGDLLAASERDAAPRRTRAALRRPRPDRRAGPARADGRPSPCASTTAPAPAGRPAPRRRRRRRVHRHRPLRLPLARAGSWSSPGAARRDRRRYGGRGGNLSSPPKGNHGVPDPGTRGHRPGPTPRSSTTRASTPPTSCSTPAAPRAAAASFAKECRAQRGGAAPLREPLRPACGSPAWARSTATCWRPPASTR